MRHRPPISLLNTWTRIRARIKQIEDRPSAVSETDQRVPSVSMISDTSSPIYGMKVFIPKSDRLSFPEAEKPAVSLIGPA